MKRCIALLLALVMTLFAIPSMAADTTEHFNYTASYIGASGAEIDDMYHAICDKFNVDFEMVSYGWGDYASAASMMINGGTMLDMLTVDTGFETISTYADQGLIRPLPENWQEAYPDIYTYMKNSNLIELLTEEDGRIYCVPKAIYAHFTTGDTYLWHHTLYYRADWAKQLGYEFGDTVTISQLSAFAADCVKNNLSGTGNTIGLTLRAGMINELMRLSNPYYGTFTKVDGQYVWGPTMEGTADGIKLIKQLYNSGVIDPDFYVYGTGAEMNMFTSGQAASMIYDGLVGSYGGLVESMVSSGAASSSEDAFEKTAVTVLVNDANEWHGNETSNYCWANVFSNDMSEAEFTRLLEVLNFLYSREGELLYNLGIEGVSYYQDGDSFKTIFYNDDGEMATIDANKDFYALTRNEEGAYLVGEKVGSAHDEANTYKGKEYPSKVFWFRQAILGDDFMLVDPAANPTVIDRISKCYETRYENAMEHGYCPVDYDYIFFTSDAKNEYSVGINDEVLRLVSDTSIPLDSVESAWNDFINEYRVMWEPVVADLNAAFAQ